MKRILACVMTVCMVLSMLTFALPASAENAVTSETVGRSFTSDDMVIMDGTLDRIPHTYEVWIKVPTGGATGNIFSNYLKDKHFSSETARVKMFIDSNGAPNIQWYDEIKTLYEVDFDKVNVKTGNWTHLAIVQEKNNTFSCYVNGTKYTTSFKYSDSATYDTAFSYPEIGKRRTLNYE